jgi:hypothetical protein
MLCCKFGFRDFHWTSFDSAREAPALCFLRRARIVSLKTSAAGGWKWMATGFAGICNINDLRDLKRDPDEAAT